jgi:response regulator RpfG family c-di-GMP phosphodiesterase
VEEGQSMSLAKRPDAYAYHLAQVNLKNVVLVSVDILNEDGVLLVKKGAAFDQKTAELIVKHKLLRPLEQSVKLEKMIDAEALFKAFSLFFSRYPDCERVHKKQNLALLLRDLCTLYAEHELLQQKLTVLSMQRVQDFDKGLFCAWLALALAQKMGLSQQQLSDIFLAGLIHDAGMLHISLDILDKKGQLTPDEWRTIQGHTLMGESFLKQIPGLSPGVALATLEHHERRDGTGYPAGKFAEKLSNLSHILAIADSLGAIRMLKLSGPDGNLANLLPIIQFNVRSYDPDCYKALFSLIRSAGLTPGWVFYDGDIDAQVRVLILAHRQLSRCFEPFEGVLKLLPAQSPVHGIRSAIIQVQSCWFMVASSGLVAAGLLQWLEQLLTGVAKEDYVAVEEINVLLKELHWQLLEVRKSLAMLKEDESMQATETQQTLTRALALQKGLDEVFKESTITV